MINESIVEEILRSQDEEENQPESEEISRRSFLWLGAGAIGVVYAGIFD